MQQRQPLRGFVVLVVDDDADNRETAASIIECLGCSAIRAGSSEEALMVLGSGAHVDLVFSDVVMPRTSGVTLARMVRERHVGMPVVLSTGHAEAVDTITEIGAIPLIKPYSIERLEAILTEQLRVEPSD